MKSPLAAIYEDSFPVPDEAKSFFQEGMEPEIKISITQKTFQKATDIADILKILREIDKPERIGESHRHVMMINLQEGNTRPISEIIGEVKYYHQEWSDLADSDAAKLALTQMTKLRMDIEPEPYAPQELELEFDNDWEKPRAVIPATMRKLTDTYERRLKVFNDMVSKGGLLFHMEVNRRINESFTRMVGEQGKGARDKAGFLS